MRDKIAERYPHGHFVDSFVEANSKGAEQFGRLWLTASDQATQMFREAGFGDDLAHSDKRLASAIARTLYRVLTVAKRRTR